MNWMRNNTIRILVSIGVGILLTLFTQWIFNDGTAVLGIFSGLIAYGTMTFLVHFERPPNDEKKHHDELIDDL